MHWFPWGYTLYSVKQHKATFVLDSWAKAFLAEIQRSNNQEEHIIMLIERG